MRCGQKEKTAGIEASLTCGLRDAESVVLKQGTGCLLTLSISTWREPRKTWPSSGSPHVGLAVPALLQAPGDLRAQAGDTWAGGTSSYLVPPQRRGQSACLPILGHTCPPSTGMGHPRTPRGCCSCSPPTQRTVYLGWKRASSSWLAGNIRPSWVTSCLQVFWPRFARLP